MLTLCQSVVGKDCTPIYLEIDPVEHAKSGNCFPAVEHQVQAYGGSACYGWRIWELSRVFVEAEFHAIWRDPEDRLREITPDPDGLTQILFLPDPVRVYEGKQVNNIRQAIFDDPSVHEFFQACDDWFNLMNRGDRAMQHLIVLEESEVAAIEMRKAMAMSKIIQRIPQPGRNDPCPCGSGKKFKKCCGK